MSERIKKAWGFTLIELLIVVAIIAILAAIAVPNFLEAQLRAKIGRVKADMRTIATALESYAIDYNGNYPHAKAYFEARIQGQFDRAGIIAFTCLSSPVAYLTTTRFMDPFNRASNDIDQFGRNIAMLTQYNKDLPGSLVFENTKLYYASNNKPITPATRPRWFLISLGPDYSKGPNTVKNERPDPTGVAGWQLSNYLSSTDPDKSCRFDAWQYDSSNGSISGGDIIRLP